MSPRISQFNRLLSFFAAGVAGTTGTGCSRSPEPPPAANTTAAAATAARTVLVAAETSAGTTRVTSVASAPAAPKAARKPAPKPGIATAPQAAGAAQSAQDKWLSYDAATNTVTFELIAGPFTFNGYRNGEGTLVVPPKANIVMNFVNKDGTPHSAILISGEGPIPNSASDPAIPRAYTSKVLEGMPQEAGDVMRFPVPETGTYRIFCGVPGHGLSGMWIWMKIDPEAKAPSFGPTKG